jgi:hypothetical protein
MGVTGIGFLYHRTRAGFRGTGFGLWNLAWAKTRIHRLVAQTTVDAKKLAIVIPKGGSARGICFFPKLAEKQIPRFARDDNE